MKLNLPSTWTSQKMSPLFLITLLSANGVKAGQNFVNCLSAQWGLNNVYYSMLLNYSLASDAIMNNGGTLYLCCLQSQNSCSVMSTGVLCPVSNYFHPYCNKIAQNIFCVEHSGKCGGIAGNNLITTNTTIGTCPSDLSTTASYLDTVTQGGIGYSTLNCPAGSVCSGLKCWLDNNGWTCSGYGATYGNCFLQWTVQSSSTSTLTPTINKSPISPISSSNSMTTSSIAIPSNSSDNPYLIEEIVIPVGAAVGVGSISGLTYYLIRKKRKKSPQLNQGNERIELEPFKEETPILPTRHTEAYLAELPTYGEIINGTKNGQSEHKGNKLDVVENNNHNIFLKQIRTKLGNEQDLLDNFLDAQELLQTATDRNLASAQRNFQRVKESLGDKISWREMKVLEENYSQHPNEYIAQVEVSNPSRVPDAYLRN